MGQRSKFKPRLTLPKINKTAKIEASSDNNKAPVYHRRNGLSRPKRCSWCIERGSEDCIKDHPHFKETGKCYWCYKNEKECTPSQSTNIKNTLAIHKTLKEHIGNLEAIYEASAEVDDPEILKWFCFSKNTKKVLLLFGNGRLDALLERLDRGDNLNHDGNTGNDNTNAYDEDSITDDDDY
ncbi:hypothetical protein E3Q16_03375 [Wallemia mellicola]|uniref:C2H2-type domain-containing protein n=1 Tax=Wallemia mellicola TaxID=1708541 RepID=A0AB74KDU0_9BASI|nr:hypothetical protein E3Q24_03317 [Wallemia mellicola]TIC02683.1 hypothetical protein E3Q16_03375 [Wallemia mellicola]TIC21581.1 hypothetical protein E3Q12_03341 [Wallemia mellicola]TIC60401.1 hypothetical protein E3Q03_03241 [Wallemia mellicola]